MGIFVPNKDYVYHLIINERSITNSVIFYALFLHLFRLKNNQEQS